MPEKIFVGVETTGAPTHWDPDYKEKIVGVCIYDWNRNADIPLLCQYYMPDGPVEWTYAKYRTKDLEGLPSIERDRKYIRKLIEEADTVWTCYPEGVRMLCEETGAEMPRVSGLLESYNKVAGTQCVSLKDLSAKYGVPYGKGLKERTRAGLMCVTEITRELRRKRNENSAYKAR